MLTLSEKKSKMFPVTFLYMPLLMEGKQTFHYVEKAIIPLYTDRYFLDHANVAGAMHIRGLFRKGKELTVSKCVI